MASLEQYGPPTLRKSTDLGAVTRKNRRKSWKTNRRNSGPTDRFAIVRVIAKSSYVVADIDEELIGSLKADQTRTGVLDVEYDID